MTELFKINKHMIATPRLEALRRDAQEGNTIVGISNNAVVRRDLDTQAMAADANQQPGRRVDGRQTVQTQGGYLITVEKDDLTIIEEK